METAVASFFQCLFSCHVNLCCFEANSVTGQSLLTSSFIHLEKLRPVHARVLNPENGLEMQIVAAGVACDSNCSCRSTAKPC